MLPFPLRFDVAMKNIPGIMDPSLNGGATLATLATTGPRESSEL